MGVRRRAGSGTRLPSSRATCACTGPSGSTSSTSGVESTVREPVSITGAGVVTPIGQDLDSFWAGLVTGVSGIGEIERFPVGDLRASATRANRSRDRHRPRRDRRRRARRPGRGWPPAARRLAL
ncbi:MAG: hypothetical protein DMD86_19565 [Candidatus Rokuibacteriota bacterium]|nr:MAG: hypothetical protein DMD86_19565 [Candidatus Rokubacteria bacterium]